MGWGCRYGFRCHLCPISAGSSSDTIVPGIPRSVCSGSHLPATGPKSLRAWPTSCSSTSLIDLESYQVCEGRHPSKLLRTHQTGQRHGGSPAAVTYVFADPADRQRHRSPFCRSSRLFRGSSYSSGRLRSASVINPHDQAQRPSERRPGRPRPRARGASRLRRRARAPRRSPRPVSHRSSSWPSALCWSPSAQACSPATTSSRPFAVLRPSTAPGPASSASSSATRSAA